MVKHLTHLPVVESEVGVTEVRECNEGEEHHQEGVVQLALLLERLPHKRQHFTYNLHRLPVHSRMVHRGCSLLPPKSVRMHTQ